MGLLVMMEIASSLNFLVSCLLLLMSFPISQIKQKDESFSTKYLSTDSCTHGKKFITKRKLVDAWKNLINGKENRFRKHQFLIRASTSVVI